MANTLAQHLLNQQVMGMSCMAMIAAFPSTIMEAVLCKLRCHTPAVSAGVVKVRISKCMADMLA